MRVEIPRRLACLTCAAVLLLAGARATHAGDAAPRTDLLRRSAPSSKELRLPTPTPGRAYFLRGRARITDAGRDVGPLLALLTASFLPQRPLVLPERLLVLPDTATRVRKGEGRSSLEALGDVALSVQVLPPQQGERVRLAAALREAPVADFRPAWSVRLSRERTLSAPDLGIQALDQPLGFLLDEPLQILGDVASKLWDIELGSNSLLQVSSRFGPRLGGCLLYLQVASEERRPLGLSPCAGDSALAPLEDEVGRVHAVFLGFDVGL